MKEIFFIKFGFEIHGTLPNFVGILKRPKPWKFLKTNQLIGQNPESLKTNQLIGQNPKSLKTNQLIGQNPESLKNEPTYWPKPWKFKKTNQLIDQGPKPWKFKKLIGQNSQYTSVKSTLGKNRIYSF